MLWHGSAVIQNLSNTLKEMFEKKKKILASTKLVKMTSEES